MTTEMIHVSNNHGPMALVEEQFQLAQRLVLSGLLPKAITKPEAALAIIIAGQELGLAPMQALRSIYIIEGKPLLSADLQLALVKKSPCCKYFRLLKSTGEIATYETLRDGDPEPTLLSFTLEQAKAAGVATKDNWRKYPDAMLRARCISALAKIVYPDLMMGVYDPDEIPQREAKPQTETRRALVAPATTVAGNGEAEVVYVDPRQLEIPVAATAEPSQFDQWKERLDNAANQGDLDVIAMEASTWIDEAAKTKARKLYTAAKKRIAKAVAE